MSQVAPTLELEGQGAVLRLGLWPTEAAAVAGVAVLSQSSCRTEAATEGSVLRQVAWDAKEDPAQLG